MVGTEEVEMRGCEDVKMSGGENLKMWRCTDLI